MSDTKPWERRPDETSTNYQAFRCYRDLGPARSLPRAFERYSDERGLKADQPTGTFRSWCSEFDWVRRAELWDDHEDERRRLVRQAKKEEALDVMADNIVGLTKTLVLIAAGKKPEKMPGDHAQIRAIENALDRLGINAPKQVEITGKDGGAIETHEQGSGEESIDFSKLDNDELREFIRLRRKAKAKADGNGDDK